MSKFKPMERPDTARVLRDLKPFQRDTVDYVFDQMYDQNTTSRRFLVADEVGLGKTIVARGLIARMIDRFWEEPDHRIDIVYICSNGSIARQNLNKLNFFQKSDYPIPDRITMLPQVLKDLECQRLNLVSFTPGTSFNLGSSEGRVHERALLYWLLPDSWRQEGGKRAVAVLMGGIRSVERFQQFVDESEKSGMNEGIRTSFASALNEQPDLAQEFRRLCGLLGTRGQLSDTDRWARATLVGRLRSTLARTCVFKLEPDLVILDEFQRFKDLLHGTDAASDLARHLFKYDDARVLLLSATPYKMYTLHEESAEDDHYADFAKTVGFLQDGGSTDGDVKVAIDRYRHAVFSWSPGDGQSVRAARLEVEAYLKRIMVRTERLASSEDRNGMLIEVTPEHVQVTPRDVHQYGQLQRVARLVGYGDVIEFWKSAPYVLNFMEDYDLKGRFVDGTARSDVSQRLAGILRDDRGCVVNWKDIEEYRRVDPANARLRSLLGATVGRGTAGLMWVPPTLPYYGMAGQFAKPETKDFTKQLVFSSWQVVPKVVASLVTYEAERELVSTRGTPSFANTAEARKRSSRLLRFSRSRGRLTGMPLAAILYPSETLSATGDPLEIAGELRQASESLPTLDDVLRVARGRIAGRLAGLDISTDGPPDECWYWAAPVLLDLQEHGAVVRRWFSQSGLAGKWAGDEPEEGEEQAAPAPGEDEQPQAWDEHVEEFRKLLRAPMQLGSQPKDLLDTLALTAVAGPANAALRALRRLGPSATADVVDLRNAAGQIAAAMRSIFNDPAITAFLRSTSSIDPRSASSDDRYWQLVLNYCADGCLQSVLDEYVHLLGDCGGRRGKKPTEFIKPMLEALTLYSATMAVDEVTVDAAAEAVTVTGPHQRKRLRTSYAARFGAQRKDDAGGAERNRKLQAAFNSPFWPFVLCSTSIGQEGLDFHYYCHAVVHWNLPSNPVDLEQREGRVHRYKGHAVRKNVVQRFGLPTQRDGRAVDPWYVLFRSAIDALEKPDGGLTPFWLYSTDGGARIERHVPSVPLSLDRARAESLRRSLAVYRMAFGQARQEDVVAFLQRFPADQLKAASDDLRIDLSPPPSRHWSVSEHEPTETAQAPALEESEPVWAGTEDEPPDVHFGDIERLLDDFRALVGEQVDGTHVPPEVKASVLADLLDAFNAASGRRGGDDDTEAAADAGMAAPSLEVLRSLLDEFVALDRPVVVDDLLPRLQQLLDQFVTVRASARSSFQGHPEDSSHA